MADLVTPMSLRVAATLRLADRIGETGATVEDLAAQTSSSAPVLSRLLDHLVTVGILVCDTRTDHYGLTELGRNLCDGAGHHLSELLDINSAVGRAELAFVELLDTVRSGQPAYPRRYGRGFWDDLAISRALQRSFDARLGHRVRAQAAQIVDRYDWARFCDIVDVGGGNGTLLRALLQAHPSLRGTVLDLPSTAATAAQAFHEAGLSDRAAVVGRSFFEPLPGGADAYVLSDVIHNWDDTHAAAILDQCAHAAGGSGSVIVIEAVHGRAAEPGVDLFMMICFGGRERTIDEIAELAGQSDLRLRGTASVADDRTLLEFRSSSVPEVRHSSEGS
jgi:hypothetical protein